MKVKRKIGVQIRGGKTLSNEGMAYASFILYYIWQTGNFFVQKCFGEGTVLSRMVYLILAAGIGLALISALRKKAALYALTALIVLFVYALSYVLGYADVSVLQYNFVWTFVICVPVGFTILCMGDLEKLCRMLYRMAKPMVGILCATFFAVFMVFKNNLDRYDLPMSYALLFWCIILCNAILEKVRGADMIFLLGGLGCILLWGSRGAYLCFAFFVLQKVMFDIEANRRQTLIFLGGGV